MVDSIVAILSGLGIFLFGMYFLENALREASGNRFKEILKRSTSTNLKSIFTGAISTSILQSSSVISLMALSFVGAGLMQLSSGIGVIFGANIGTTATSWIVALVGFKVNIEAFAIPMIGFAGIALIMLNRYPKVASYAKVFIGFGILFLGLEFLKDSIEGIKQSFDLSAYLNYGDFTFLFIGFALTAIIQSSSASTAIVLSSLYSGIISFEVAAIMVIGTNVGTTVTALLGSIGGTADKKRVALSHLLFNVATAVIAFLMVDILSSFILNTLGFKDDLTTALALFHTIFNVIGVIVFAPFIPLFARALSKLFKEEQKELLKYINQVDVNSSEPALIALKNEAKEFFKRASDFGLYLQNIEPAKIKTLKVRTLLYKYPEPLVLNYQEMYEDLKTIEIEIIKYANKISSSELEEEMVSEISTILNSVREIGFGIKTLKDIKSNMDDLASRDEEYLIEFYNTQRRQIIRLFKNILLIIEGESARELKALKIYNTILESNQESIKNLADIIKEYNLNDLTAASMMNVSRAMFISSEYFYNAIKDLSFQNEQERNDFNEEEKNSINNKEATDENGN